MNSRCLDLPFIGISSDSGFTRGADAVRSVPALRCSCVSTSSSVCWLASGMRVIASLRAPDRPLSRRHLRALQLCVVKGHRTSPARHAARSDRGRRNLQSNRRAPLPVSFSRAQGPASMAFSTRSSTGGAPATASDAPRRSRSTVLGYSSHWRPSSLLPPDFGLRPPHCLKKNATVCVRHVSRIERSHSARTGRAPGPLSPPAMTQWIPERSSAPRGPSNGSSERNRSEALVRLRCRRRPRVLVFSMEVPSQICGGAGRPG